MREGGQAERWKRNAVFFVGGQFLSMFGSMLVSHAITWHITLTRQSGGLMAVFTAAAMLPMVLISPFAGVWADRYNRKYLVNIADGAIALITLFAAVFYGAGGEGIWFLLAVVMARSVGQGIQQPASGALIPQIVPAEHLARFNGIQSAAQSLTMFAAPMAAAALLTFLPMETIFYIDVVTAGIGIATVFFCVKVSGPANQGERASGVQAYYGELAEGIRYIGKEPWLRTLFAASALFGVLASPAAMLTPLQVARTFGGEAARAFGDAVWGLTAIELAFSVGMTAGGVAIAVWGGFRNKAHTMTLAWLLFGAAALLLGVVTNFWVYMGVMIFCGCTMPVFNTPAMTLLQTKIPPRLMGRVFSVLMMINGIAMPLGMALFGPLGDAVRIEILLIVTGAMLIACGVILRGRRELILAGAPGPEQPAKDAGAVL